MLMTVSIVTNPLFIAISAPILTLLSKWAWDRWLSQNSRVTVKHCDLIRAKCHDDLMSKIRTHNERLNNGDGIFKSNRHYQRAVIITLLAMCKHMQMDCDEIVKTFVDEDLIA